MLKLIPSQINELDEFIKSFENSELGQNYFSSKEFIQETFFEFSKKNTILTATFDNNIIGFICYIPNGAFHSFPYLHLLTILPDYRGHGFGKQILNIFEERYLKDASKVFLVVADFNPKAKTFYEKNGFTQVGKIPNLYRMHITEFLMIKILN